jgi:hypothetical protein
LAVKTTDVATPAAFVVAVFTPPVKAPLAPLPGAAKVTTTPLTGLLPASLTVACSVEAKTVLIVALCGVPPDAVMAVGDNLNDLEMLEFAGTAVVMGNATDAMRNRGFDVVPSHDEHGLAVAIRRFALGND